MNLVVPGITKQNFTAILESEGHLCELLTADNVFMSVIFLVSECQNATVTETKLVF